jgi:hypothetical protein
MFQKLTQISADHEALAKDLAEMAEELDEMQDAATILSARIDKLAGIKAAPETAWRFRQ